MPMTNDIERLHGRISELEARVAALEGVTDDGWITWTGGECPVEGNVVVQVRYRSGAECTYYAANSCKWDHAGTSGDIIAYRVVK